jgi:hypothetical protein
MDLIAMVEKLLPSRNECKAWESDLRAANPRKSSEELAEAAIKNSRRRAAAIGALSGLAANPLTMIPAAGADVYAVLRTEANLAGLVASMIDPDTLKDEETFKTDILAILFPAAISNALQTVGVQAGRQTSKVLVRKYISKDVLKVAIRWAAKYLGIKLTQRAIITKVVPLAGAAIGGGWNWFEVRRLGRRALAYHQDQSIDIEPDPTPTT